MALENPSLYLVKAFTASENGGNAAGVVLNADNLTQERKQAIAADLGLSEAAFVSASEIGDVKVEFFTPNRQIPHCGHATVATFGLLRQKGLLQKQEAIKESIEGPRHITYKQEKVYTSQLAPKYTTLSEVDVKPEDVATSLGLPSNFTFVSDPLIVNTGVSFLLVQLNDEIMLAALQPDQGEIAAISDKLGLVGYYVFTSSVAGADATTRMFAPSYGIPEESATGMAAGPLACYLYDFLQVQKTDFLIRQGYLMQPPSPSQIEVELELNEQNKIGGLKAGGSAFVVKELELPSV